jgi:hypothetical protein
MKLTAPETFAVNLRFPNLTAGNFSCLFSIGVDRDPPMDEIDACVEGTATSRCPRVQLTDSEAEIRTHLELALKVTIIQSKFPSVTIFGETKQSIHTHSPCSFFRKGSWCTSPSLLCEDWCIGRVLRLSSAQECVISCSGGGTFCCSVPALVARRIDMEQRWMPGKNFIRQDIF